MSLAADMNRRTGVQQVTVLGATGSIGCSTLDVIARHPDQFSLFALTGNSRVDELAEQCRQYTPRFAVVPDRNKARELRNRLSGIDVQVLDGPAGLAEVASAPEVDSVMASIVGAAGLVPTLAAARAGKRVLLANKEALVMTGRLFLNACESGGAQVLPIDSEHNAVFQCLPADRHRVSRIILTASGGPFRQWTAEQMAQATPQQACAHPNWSMGQKISVDSATMMNKGLELIEAHYLFGMPREGLDILIHPQSIVHSMVEYADGSTLAQLGNPDMRTPIAHALAYPRRIVSGVPSLSLAEIGQLDFEAPDTTRFPCLGLAIDALEIEGAAPCVLNAANEVAVEAFLQSRIGFGDIARVNASVLDALGHLPGADSIEQVHDQDRQAREMAHSQVKAIERAE